MKRRRLPLLALFAADAISVTGNVLALVAVPWFVLELTGSAALTGITAFFSALASLLAAFFGGALVDRVGFRRMSVLADIASAAAIVAIPIIQLTVGIEPWQLMILVFLGALLDAPGTAARTSMLPDLAELAGWPIERATGLSQAVRRGAILVGAPIAGALIVIVGTQGVFLIDAVSFLVSAVLIGVLTPAIAYHEPSEEEEAEAAAELESPRSGRRRYIDDLLIGLRFVWKDRLVRAIVLTVMVTNFLDSPLLGVVLPVYVKEVYGSSVELGLLFGIFGGAALLGAIGYGMIGQRLPRRLTFSIAFVIVGLPFWVLALQPPFGIALIAFFVVGLAAGPINPIISTVIFERVPRHVRGRVMSSITAAAFVAMPLGMLVFGFISQQFGVITAIVIIAASYLAVTLATFVNPAYREMDRPPGGATTSAPAEA
ncbi:MAG TPA: MFS transporter [Candidatus Limnocylindrales bacterium]|nr:MFS transporter [Candidatus Limnocylindrales bacterium]